jgi:hypothetical protein
MTTVVSIISDALRETNLIPLGVSPSTAQEAEAFALLSTIVSSVLGNEMGENLSPLPLGQDGIEAPTGYPWWNNSLPANAFVLPNTRLMLNLTDEGFVYFDPDPHDGARMGVVDCANNLDINPLTIHGNGRKLDADFDVVLDVPGTAKEWMYRADLGTWVTVTPLDLAGNMPWPSEFDDMFIIMLSLRLNPRYGQVIHPASMETLRNVKKKFSARYGQSNTEMPSEDGLVFLTNYNSENILRQAGDPNSMFNRGYPY